MKSRTVLTAALVLTVSAVSSAQSPSPTGTQRLAGVWRVVEFCDDGSTDLHGRPWIGYFIYAASGELSLQAMDLRAPVRAFADPDHPTPIELTANNESYFGYFGRWTVTSDSTVIHHVVGGTVPDYIGTDQLRYFRIHGDTLNIGEEKPLPCRVLVKVGSARGRP